MRHLRSSFLYDFSVEYQMQISVICDWFDIIAQEYVPSELIPVHLCAAFGVAKSLPHTMAILGN